MPSLRLLRQTSPSDVLATVISGLEVLKETSHAIAVIPLMGDVIGIALGIAKTMEVRILNPCRRRTSCHCLTHAYRESAVTRNDSFALRDPCLSSYVTSKRQSLPIRKQ